MKNKLKVFILLVLIIAVILGIGFLIFNAVRSVNYNKNAKNPVVTLDVEGYGKIEIELYPEYAPNTVAYFTKLVENGYYDGKVFFGTDGEAVGAGMIKNTEQENTENSENNSELVTPNTSEDSQEEKPPVVEDLPRVSDFDKSVTPYVDNGETKSKEDTDDYKVALEGEFVANGYNDNTLRFEKGTIGFYRQNYNGLTKESYNSATSLFFIETKENSGLNGNYVAFGKVRKGMDIVEKILQLPTIEKNASTNLEEGTTKYFQDLPVITKATVDTFGTNYGMPKYIEAFDYNSYLTNLLLQQYSNQ